MDGPVHRSRFQTWNQLCVIRKHMMKWVVKQMCQVTLDIQTTSTRCKTFVFRGVQCILIYSCKAEGLSCTSYTRFYEPGEKTYQTTNTRNTSSHPLHAKTITNLWQQELNMPSSVLWRCLRKSHKITCFTLLQSCSIHLSLTSFGCRCFLLWSVR